MAGLLIPPALSVKLDRFVAAKASGSVLLRLKDGAIQGYEIQERGTLGKNGEPAVTKR